MNLERRIRMANFNVNDGNGANASAIERFLLARGAKGVVADGKLSETEASLWNELKDSVTAEEAQEFGFPDLDLGHTTAKAAPRKASGVNIYVDARTDININIVVNSNIRELVKDLVENFDVNIGKVINTMNANTDELVQVVKALYEQCQNNHEELMDILKKILANTELTADKAQDMYVTLNKLLEKSLAFYQKMEKLDIEELVNTVKNIYNEELKQTEKQDEQTAILKQQSETLNDIYEAIKNLSADQKANFNILMQKFQAGKVSLDKVLALLAAIKADTSEGNKIANATLEAVVNGNEKILDYLEKIYNKLGDFDANVKAGFENLALQIVNSGDNIEARIKDLEKLLTQIKDLQTEDNEISKEILNAIKNMDINPNVIVDLTEVINAIKENGQKIDDLKPFLAAINANVEASNVKLDEIKAVEQEILAAIKDLGAEFAAGLSDLLVEVKNGNMKLDDLKVILKAIKKDTGDIKITAENQQKLLESVAEYVKHIDGDVHELKDGQKAIYDGVIAIFNKINEGVDVPDYTQILNDIYEKIGDIGDTNNNNLLTIISMLGNRNDIDLDDLKAFLQEKTDEIIEAIQDHDVHVTVDVTGQVECKCSCEGEGQKHEGIINDLTDILNAKRRVMGNDDATGIDNTPADNNNQFKFDPTKPVYTLGGVLIRNPENLPKGVYIQDGHKFIVK